MARRIVEEERENTPRSPTPMALHKEEIMGFMDDAKDAADATGKKVGEFVDDTKERVSDKVDEMKADADVSRAEKERDATHAKNEYKESLRD